MIRMRFFTAQVYAHISIYFPQKWTFIFFESTSRVLLVAAILVSSFGHREMKMKNMKKAQLTSFDSLFSRRFSTSNKPSETSPLKMSTFVSGSVSETNGALFTLKEEKKDFFYCHRHKSWESLAFTCTQHSTRVCGSKHLEPTLFLLRFCLRHPWAIYTTLTSTRKHMVCRK